MEIGERVLAATFEELLPHLDERRLALGAEARWLGMICPRLTAQSSVSAVTRAPFRFSDGVGRIGVSGRRRGPGAGSAEGGTGIGRAGRRAG
jgi:hypothetical protein